MFRARSTRPSVSNVILIIRFRFLNANRNDIKRTKSKKNAGNYTPFEVDKLSRLRYSVREIVLWVHEFLLVRDIQVDSVEFITSHDNCLRSFF